MGTRRQMGKGYERHLRYTQHDRDKHTFQKAKRKGLGGMINEVQQLKEEIQYLESARRTDNNVIHNQREVIEKLENDRHRLIVWRAASIVFIVLLSVWVSLLVS